ncbi:saccharopine dehydrogenase [Suillus occidentalis]|nr:saccharopine dehydrogenase [Suillus occidentalis]
MRQATLGTSLLKNGWFREISSQWPGQAMTLKVNRILDIKKSLYVDVLVFESETYSNVLVLDGVIQCTERDEFSYQEMIAHLPLASHSNPKKVLVIGGGDGGVVREVLKHDIVEEVVLCDIDEAVIRVSKIYLPRISALLDSPRVKVFVGDKFKFLAENEAIYDVIISDSSDLVGPAEALFQQPYFKLLHDALTPGGHISIQAESQTCTELLPQFVQSYLEDGKDILPVFGRAAAAAKVAAKGKKVCKVLLLGSGFVARPCAEYVVRGPSNELTIACRTLQSAQGLAEGLPNAQGISLDVNNTSDLEAQVAAHDLVISLIPYTYHVNVIKAAIKAKVHVVTTSYEAKSVGIVVMNEIGLDPGIDHYQAFSGNPLGYNVLLALLNSAAYLSENKQIDISGNELMGYAKPYFISPAFAFVAYPNRHSAEIVVRGTLRYRGFPEFIKALVELGCIREGLGLTWAQVMQQAIGANDAAEWQFPNDAEATRINSGLRRIGRFSSETMKTRAGNLLDTLCPQLETLMKYEQGERDLVMLQDKFVVEWADGSEQTLTSTLEQYGSPSGHSAAALTVSVPCSIATPLALDGAFKTPGGCCEVTYHKNLALIY